MTILITGGAGYIGSHAAVELLERGSKVVILDNFLNSSKEVINRIQEITGKEVDFHHIDLLDKAEIERLFDHYDFKAVIHFAGLKAVGESVEMPLRYYKNNLSGTLNLLESMGDHDVKKLVFSSSATVYGEPEMVPIKETASLSATNPYGRTKLMIEEILRDLAASDKAWRIAILRYFNPVGAHSSGRIGENPAGIPNNLMPYITQVAVGKREFLNVFGNDYETADGTGVRDFIHVSDLVNGHICALDYLNHHSGAEEFNLGTGHGYSVLDLVHTFSEVTGKRIPYKFTERRPGDIGECYADSNKAQQLLNWTAEKDLRDMCRDSWKWQSENPNGYSERL